MDSQLQKNFDSNKFEQLLYEKWENSNCFHHEIDHNKEPFVISMPPPNATGTLHLGHAMMLALEDTMVRHARMQGMCTLWLPGTDHAAIATQSVVEKKLQDEGVINPRAELGRKRLLEAIQDFVDDSKDTIRNQVRKMGASCDWKREKYTFDDDLNHAVNTFFERMYEDNLIYHGDRIVNWDPKMQTTVADDELEYIEEKTKFYYFQYGPIVIGTARPETKFADKIIVVHPDDERYKDLHGKEFEVEWINGPIKAKVIADECMDMEMGTGAMTITPAHSLVDFELAEKYGLEKPQIIDFQGKLTAEAGEFEGMHIEEARDKIVEKLEKKGLLVKIEENYEHNIAVNYRRKGIIEPQIMKQWFIDVNKKVIDWKGEKRSIKEVLQDTVRSEMIEIVPSKFNKIYFDWVDNLRDWCISRQIWWGHQIPVWFKVSKEDKEKWEQYPESSSFLLQSLNIEILDRKTGEKMPEEEGEWIRDPDTLDTWFSAALWTFSTLGWPNITEELKYFHPTNVLETGYDIIFFWVARMILASTYCLRTDGFPEEKCIPFKTVYLHGLVKDRNGKKMSKSRPETCIDPLDMIEKYGTDAVRLSLIIGSTPGNDTRLYEEKIAGFRNFVNKVWNGARFALMNVSEEDLQDHRGKLQPTNVNSLADKWIITELNYLIEEVDKNITKHRYSDVGSKIYEFFWNQFCAWYLEYSKGKEVNPDVLLYVLKTSLRLLHPFMPFVTEQIWSHLHEEKMLINESWPKSSDKLKFQEEYSEFEKLIYLISSIRSLRSEAQINSNTKINVTIIEENILSGVLDNENMNTFIRRMANIGLLNRNFPPEKKTISKAIRGALIHIELDNITNIEEKIAKILNEIASSKDYISRIQRKLDNENFVKNAPEQVIEKEKEKLKHETEKLQKLEEQYKSYSS